jgi:hypothetical protein
MGDTTLAPRRHLRVFSVGGSESDRGEVSEIEIMQALRSGRGLIMQGPPFGSRTHRDRERHWGAQEPIGMPLQSTVLGRHPKSSTYSKSCCLITRCAAQKKLLSRT